VSPGRLLGVPGTPALGQGVALANCESGRALEAPAVRGRPSFLRAVRSRSQFQIERRHRGLIGNQVPGECGAISRESGVRVSSTPTGRSPVASNLMPENWIPSLTGIPGNSFCRVGVHHHPIETVGAQRGRNSNVRRALRIERSVRSSDDERCGFQAGCPRRVDAEPHRWGPSATVSSRRARDVGNAASSAGDERHRVDRVNHSRECLREVVT
jgi:hypothetical protein